MNKRIIRVTVELNEEEQHIIDVVELANDMGLEAPEEYYKEYERIVNKEAQNGQ